jgi:hypothetical protein
MSDFDISVNLKQFIFEYVDSVELIEVLLFIRSNSDKWFSAAQISTELRSNPTSIGKRLAHLSSIGLIDQNQDQIRFRPVSEELKNTVTELSNEYLLRRHRIFELIFSSSKTARQFANAFIVNKKPSGD